MFAFRLAGHLGGMTVREMLARMGGDEFTEWLAFERLEPFGALVDDLRAGTIAAQTRNAARGNKDDYYFESEDFAPLVRMAKQRTAAPARPDTLSPDQHTALFDAVIFGRTVH